MLEEDTIILCVRPRQGAGIYRILAYYVIIIKYSASAEHIIIILLVSIYNHARELTDGRTDKLFV